MLKKIITAIAACAIALSAAITASATSVGLKSGNYADWIDRVDFPDYATNLYNTLVEASDGDKNSDYLIDPTQATNLGNGTYGILIKSVKGTSDSKTKVENAATSEFNSCSSYISAMYDAFGIDHPEIFWLNGTSSQVYSLNWVSKTSGGKTTYTYTVDIYFVLKSSNFDVRESLYTGSNGVSKIYSAISERDKYVNSILSGAPSNASNYALVKYFNKVLTENNEYKTDLSYNSGDGILSWKCLSALKGSSGKLGPVCEGYTRAFKLLCDKKGIPCTIVIGTASSSLGSGAHMWAYVKLSGSWYACDITWDDPQVSGKSGAVTGCENSNWLLVGSNTVIDSKKFSQSHTVTNKVSTSGISFTNQPTLSTTAYQPKPSKVTLNSSFTSSTTAVKISWNKASNASGYYVYRYNSSTKLWSKIKKITSASTLSYKDTGLNAATKYIYKVRAYNSSNLGTSSEQIVTATKPRQTAITKTAVSKTAVKLKWTKVSCTGYRIQQYNKSTKKWVTVAKAGSDETLVKITGLTKNTSYTFRVQAYKKAGTVNVFGAASAEKTVRTSK